MFKTIVGFFTGGWQGYLIAGGLALVVGLGSGAYAGYRWELSALDSLKLTDAAKLTAAVTAAKNDLAARDAVTLKNSVADALNQQKIVTRYETITKEITSHVPDTAHCITYGLVRVLNDAAGAAAYPVPGAAAQPDDACAPVSWREFAADITADYGAKAQNDQQLTDLQSWVKDQESVVSK